MSDIFVERDGLARTIRKIFFDQKSVRSGKRYKPDSRHQKFEFWQKAAEQCIRLGARPEDYVVAAFERCRLTTGPFPNGMGGNAAAQWYRDYMEARPQQTVIEVNKDTGEEIEVMVLPAQAEIDMIVSGVMNLVFHRCRTLDKTPDVMNVLRNDILPLNALGRVLIGWPDAFIMERFAQEAQLLLRNRPDLVTAAKDMQYPIEEILEWTPKTTLPT